VSEATIDYDADFLDQQIVHTPTPVLEKIKEHIEFELAKRKGIDNVWPQE
jgi:hypothetical protein